ncbi:hypothetical protein MMC11_004797 [Xylographa trunciseda]|nr:hypothetical protein [Xylographa trunciseda]
MDSTLVHSAQSALRIPALSLWLLVAAPFVYLAYNVIYNLYFHPLAKIPGPWYCRITRLPWDYWQLTGYLHKHTKEVHLQYGEVVRLAPNELSFASAQAWHDIFGYNKAKVQWPRHPARVPQGNNGNLKSILNTPPDEHARFRRLLNHAFSEKGLQEQEPLINKYINLFIKRVGEISKGGQPVDFTSWLQMLSFDIISDLGWNEPFNCVEKGEEHSWIQTIAATAFESQLKLVFREWGIVKLAPYFIPKHMLLARIKNFKYAKARVEDRLNNGGVRGDFWDRIIIKSGDNNEAGEGLTKAEMMVTAVTLVGTGSNTVSTLLTGLSYFLGNNPHCLKKLCEEIRASFKHDDEISIPTVAHLEYLNACLNESMRLYPPVLNLLWRVPPKGGGEVCGWWIPEMTSVNISLPGMWEDPKNFARPNDFCPERFLANKPAQFANDNMACFKPFGLGTMNCLGQNLANAQARLILAKLFFNYDMELDRSKTPADWLDQQAWAVFVKKHVYVRVTQPQKQEA